MTLLLLFLGLTLFVSFLCSIMESILLSTTTSYIESMPEEKRGVSILKRFKADIDKPISAILTLNTIANTAGAAGVGAQAVEVFGDAYFGICSAVLTLLVLLCSEIIPKTIGANYWRELCVPAAYLIQGVLFVTYPLVIVAQFITHIFSKKQTTTVSREEVAALTKIAEREGLFHANESNIINNLVKMESVKVRSIMTPRTVVLAAQEDLTLEEFFNEKKFLTYSRIPIYTDSLDDITGFVLKTDILLHLANDEKKIKLKEIKRNLMACYENTSIPKFYDLMVTRKEHIALVIDEYGGMEGIITMEDVIETILGLEITDESDDQTDMQELAKELWKKRAKNLNVDLSDEPDTD